MPASYRNDHSITLVHTAHHFSLGAAACLLPPPACDEAPGDQGGRDGGEGQHGAVHRGEGGGEPGDSCVEYCDG